jgi:hypothetical protein
MRSNDLTQGCFEALQLTETAMLTLILMLALIIVPGWLDSRLNWSDANRSAQEEQS